MHEHFTSPCHHGCSELTALAYSVSKLLTSTLELIDLQSGLDPTTLPLSQAEDYCQSFVWFHPTMTVETLIGGLEVSVAALSQRVEWEKGDSSAREF